MAERVEGRHISRKTYSCSSERLKPPASGAGTRLPKMPTVHVQAGSADELQDIADSLWKAKKIVVITGAGISTNSGIPVCACCFVPHSLALLY